MPEFNIKPARDNLIVRDPINGEPLPVAGAAKPRNRYWIRRLNDGDVVEVTAKPKSKQKES